MSQMRRRCRSRLLNIEPSRRNRKIVEEKQNPAGGLMSAIKNLFPGYFAVVMATGIVSIAAKLTGIDSVAWALLVLNVAAFVILTSLLLIRIFRFFSFVKADITDHIRGPGFFTIPAGICVLGSQLIIVAGDFHLAAVLWFIGIALWAFIMYLFFAAVTTRETKPPLEKGLSGTC